MTRLLEDRIAIVTGGAQGLGQALCQRLAVEGCHVVVADLKAEQAEATAREVAQTTDRQSRAVAVDVTNEEQVAALVDSTVSQFGRLVSANLGGWICWFPMRAFCSVGRSIPSRWISGWRC